MFRIAHRLVTICAITLTQVWHLTLAQENWPHSSADWSDPLFQARVQGVYDWVNSGPDQLLVEVEGRAYRVPAYLAMAPTVNRDLQSFPARVGNLFEGEVYNEPKDWMDRRTLIEYMQRDEEIEPGFFEDRLDERTGADTHYLMANVYFLQGRLEDAVAHYEMAIEEFPLFRLAYKNSAYAQILMGNCEAALENATEASSLGALSAQLKNIQAYCAYEAGDFALAAQAAAMSKMLDPSNNTISNLHIQSLNELGHYEQALALVAGLPNREDRATLALELQLQAASHEEVYEDRLALLEIKSRLQGLAASEEAELISLKIASGLSGHIDLDRLDVYLQSDRVAAPVVETLLHTLNDSGQALPAFFQQQELPASVREQVKATPDNEIEMLLASIEVQSGNLEQAASILQRSIEQKPMHCESLLLLAKIAHLRGDALTSQSFINRASATTRECDNDSLEQRALMRIDNGEFSEAQNLMLRDWNQRIATGEIPSELYVRKFRAITSLGNRISE